MCADGRHITERVDRLEEQLASFLAEAAQAASVADVNIAAGSAMESKPEPELRLVR